MARGRRNLIMGLCLNFGVDDIAPFLYTFDKHCFDTDLVLFVHNIKDDLRHYCERKGILLVPFDGMLSVGMNPLSSRFFIWRNFLKFAGNAYEKVLVTDIRDVLFQQDCFAFDWPADLVFAAEDRPINTEPFNSKWVLETYGEDIFHAIGRKRISCAGTTFGTYLGMTEYLECMCEEIARKISHHAVQGPDQGAHNFLVHLHTFSNAVLDLSNRLVSTIAIIETDRVEIKNDVVVVDGRVSPMVHQWDRHQIVKTFIRERIMTSSLDSPADHREPIRAVA